MSEQRGGADDVWYMLQNHERYVYHYTRSTTLRRILQSRQIRFSPFSSLNDPRETKDWMLNFHSSAADLERADMGLQKRLNEHLKHEWRLACFSTDPIEACSTRMRENQGFDVIEAMYERGHSRPRMWDQYGQRYQGACLVFDRKLLDEQVKSVADARGFRVSSGAVRYRNPPLPSLGRVDPLTLSLDRIFEVGERAAAQEHLARHWKELFLLKPTDWAQEREFRWLVAGMERHEQFFVSIEQSCVGIGIGDLMNATTKRSVTRYAKSRDVDLAIMDWQNGFPQPQRTHWRSLL